MLTLRTGLAASLSGLIALLAVLAALGLSLPAAWVGLACGAVLCAAVTHGAAATDHDALGPADLVTLTRATLACAVAALVADPSPGPAAAGLLVPLTIVALVLDAVDGRVARATATMSRFGATFDGETDAFLILVLSLHVAPEYGWWVLAIGAARYAYFAAGRVWPWLRGPLPPRYWRKVVAAVQGVVLTAAAANILPASVSYAALVAALALLAESFGRDVVWTWPGRMIGRVNPPALATVLPGDDRSES